MAEENMLAEVVDGLRDIFGNELLEIILFGSFSRHEETPESDIDIAVVVNDPVSAELRNQFLELAADLDLKYGKVLSIVDIERSIMEKWGQTLPFYKNILEKGIILWKAA